MAPFLMQKNACDGRSLPSSSTDDDFRAFDSDDSSGFGDEK